MGKPKAPEPPDPKATAAAQTTTNLSTAQANAILGNVNQVTPDGNLTYTESDRRFIADETSGQKYWRGPNGEIQQNAPGNVTTPGTTTKQPIYKTVSTGRDGGAGQRQEIVGYKDVTSGGGSTTPQGWSQVSGYYVPQYTATQTLSPNQQAIKNNSDQAQINLAQIAKDSSSRIGGLLSAPLDLSSIPAAGDASALRSPQYQQLIASAGLKTGIADAGQIQRQIGSAGNIQDYIADAGTIQSQLGDAGQITRTYGTDFSADRKKVEDALFSRLNPQAARDRAALETSLANQGIRIGSTAYANKMDEFNRAQNDQRTQIVLAGGQEQSRLADLEAQRAGFQNAAQQQAYQQQVGAGTFANAAQAQKFGQNATAGQLTNAAQAQRFGQNVATGEFANAAQAQQFGQNAAGAQFYNDASQQELVNRNTAIDTGNSLSDRTFAAEQSKIQAQNAQRTQALNEAYAYRTQPLNEIAGLLAGTQIQQPNFVNANMPTIPTVDYAGLVQDNYAARMQAYQQSQAQRSSLLGGLFSAGASIIGASDRRLKKGIRSIGEYPNGMPKYAFRYIWDNDNREPEHIGLMADDVRRVRPDAVMVRDGFDHVDYGRALA